MRLFYKLTLFVGPNLECLHWPDFHYDQRIDNHPVLAGGRIQSRVFYETWSSKYIITFLQKITSRLPFKGKGVFDKLSLLNRTIFLIVSFTLYLYSLSSNIFVK